MAGRKSNWLLGCGVGCLVVLVLGVFGGVMMFRGIKTTFKDFETVEATQKKLDAQFATIETYVPASDGRIAPERVAIFLKIQQEILPQAEKLAVAAETLDGLDEGGFSFRKIARGVSGVRDMGQNLGGYLAQRNQLLLDEGMGLGEFTYLLETVYYGWLQKPLDVSFQKDDDTDYHELVARVAHGFLQRQLQAAKDAGDPSTLVPALESELSDMLADRDYVPWRGGLPSVIEDSLSPYRGELDAAYSDVGTLLGMATVTEDGKTIHIQSH